MTAGSKFGMRLIVASFLVLATSVAVSGWQVIVSGRGSTWEGWGLATCGLVALVILAIFAVLTSRQTVARPLAMLSEHAKQLSHGQYEQTITLPDHPAGPAGRQLADLARALDDMRQRLGNYERELCELDRTLREKNGSLAHALTQAEDITHIKGQFIANVSHELRTPLNVIVNMPEGLLDEFRYTARCTACNTRFVLDDGETVTPATGCLECGTAGSLVASPGIEHIGDPGAARDHISAVYRAAKHLLAVVDDLLDFNKLESGNVKLDIESIAISDLFGEVERSMRPVAASSGVEFHVEPCASDLEIRADRAKVRQILGHLVSNAIKFSPGGGRVDMAAIANGDSCLLCIRDQGIGIPADKREIIFESFRQADGGHTRPFGGTGLGLSIAKRLVELHGGVISVDSEEGEGSAFYVRLPMLPPVPVVIEDSPIEDTFSRSTMTTSSSWQAAGKEMSGSILLENLSERTETQPWRLDAGAALDAIMGDAELCERAPQATRTPLLEETAS